MSIGGSSKVKTGSEELLSKQRDRLYQATRGYTAFLQALFASRPPGQLRWSFDDEESEILITGETPVNIDTPHKRPIISIVRGQSLWDSTSRDGLQSLSLTTSDKTFTDTASGTMVLNCLSKEPVEAQYIAWICFTHIRIFKEVIQKYGRLHAISNQLQIGPVTPPGQVVRGSSSSEWRLVQVYSPFQVRSSFKVSETEDSDFHVLLRQLTMTLDAMDSGGNVAVKQETQVTE